MRSSDPATVLAAEHFSRPLDETRVAAGVIDVVALEEAARALIAALGADLSDEGIRDTPRRMAAAYVELLSPANFVATTFANDPPYNGVVLVRDIPFRSLCMHHVLPFFGVAHLAYIPGGRILGLSKLARVVDHFSRNLQIQERLTTQVADWLEENLAPRGLGVVIEAEHMCMTLRGVVKPGARTLTSDLRGAVRDDAPARAEFLSAVGGGRSEP